MSLRVLWMALVCGMVTMGPEVVAKPATGQAKLVLTSPAYEQGEPIEAELQLPVPVARAGAVLATQVTDSFGRVLVDRSQPLPGEDTTCTSVNVRVDVPGVLVMRHWLGVAATDVNGQTYYAQEPVIFRPRPGWHDYRVVMWQRHNAKRLPFLKKANIHGSIWPGASDFTPDHFVDANYRWYVEGTATSIYAPYHRWFPDKKVEHYFTLHKEQVKAERGNLNRLQRSPCLSDHVTHWIIERMMLNPTRQWRDYRPFWYSLADEPGIGGQAAASDFCFSPACRDAFREWLKERYADLAALNAEWDTEFDRWEDVIALTTDQTFARPGDNFSPWCDHKDFMDDVLMKAYQMGADTIKRFDPGTFVAIGGAQGPMAVGGWDFWKLCQVLDCMEPYYIANNYEMLRSFNPKMHLISINGRADADARYKRWYLFVHGDHGAMLWDDDSTFVDDEGNYNERAKTCMKWLAELTGGLGRQYMFTPRIDDPVAIYHSQPSLRVHWVLHVRPIGEAWIDRYSYHERVDNPYSRVRESWIKMVEDTGLQYKMLAAAQVRQGELKPYDPITKEGFKLLVMPRIIALSSEEAHAIQDFVKAGGKVIADGQVGLFDEHGKRLEAGRLDDLFGVERPGEYTIAETGTAESGIDPLKLLEEQVKPTSAAPAHTQAPQAMLQSKVGNGRCVYVNLDLIDYHHWRLHPGEEAAPRQLLMPGILEAVGPQRRTPRVVAADEHIPLAIETTVKDVGQVRIVALQRNLQLRISELGPQEYQSIEGLAAPIDVTVHTNLPGENRSFVYYDMRQGRRVGEGPTVQVRVGPHEPTILSVWPVEPAEFTATAPGHVRAGQPCGIAIKPGSDQADEFVYHAQVVQPDGQVHELYTTNWACEAGGGRLSIPLALSDPQGEWKVRLTEILTGAEKTVTFELQP